MTRPLSAGPPRPRGRPRKHPPKPEGRKRGGQPGNRNRWRHGGFSGAARKARDEVENELRRIEFVIAQVLTWHECKLSNSDPVPVPGKTVSRAGNRPALRATIGCARHKNVRDIGGEKDEEPYTNPDRHCLSLLRNRDPTRSTFGWPLRVQRRVFRRRRLQHPLENFVTLTFGWRHFMPTQGQLEAQNLYASLMEEIKIRIAAIDAGTGGQLKALPPAIIREHCYLQLRMICELIALGCIAAHGDLNQTKKLRKEWAADKIMDELGILHPDFFPQPVSAQSAPVGEISAHHLSSETKGLTKDGLIALYHECGDILHKGTVKKLLKPKMPVKIHFPDITAKAQLVVDLLSNHLIATLGGELVFLCSMNSIHDQGRAQVAIAEKVEDLPPHVNEVLDRLEASKK